MDHDETYNNLYDSIRTEIPCELIASIGLTKIERCLNFSHNNLKEGLSSGVIHYFQHITYLVGMYQNIEKNIEITWPQNFTLENRSNITKENLKLNMIRLPNFSELGNITFF